MTPQLPRHRKRREDWDCTLTLVMCLRCRTTQRNREGISAGVPWLGCKHCGRPYGTYA